MRASARAVTAALLLVASSCDGGDADPTALGAIEGQVIDGLDERPLAGVRVRERDGSGAAITDAEGRFTLRARAGTRRLYLDREGHVAGQRANVIVREGATAHVVARLFPAAPSEETVRAYFARQPVRRHAHPAHERSRVASDDDVGVVRAAEGDPGALPETIRVWRSGGTALQPTAANGWADNSCHADAVVLELPREEYVKGVIPHEWIPSWHPEALRAGAIAARTYAVNWARRGGRWDCADVDDGTVTQVYRDDRADATNEAVDATAGQVVMRDGSIISTEYSAENADPTEFGVDEPTCTGQSRFGHGRGMCQWGTHRWASAICANPPCDWGAFGMTARDHVWMVEHYFPGACVAGDVATAPPCAVIPAEGGIVDDAGPCFSAFGPSEYWRTESAGHDGGLHWTNAFEASAPSNWARWRLHFAAPGRYVLEAYVDETWGVHTSARYEIAHAGGTATVVIDQGAASGWTSLGEYDFAEAATVSLLDNESGPVPADQHLVADALRLTPVGATPGPDAGGTPMDGGTTIPGPGARAAEHALFELRGGELGGCHVGGPVGGRSTAPWLLALAVGALLARRRRAHRTNARRS